MSTEMLTTLVSVSGTLVVCLINNYFQAKNAEKKYNETIALIDYRLNELSKRVEKHNNVIERTYDLEKRVSIDEEKLRVANHRIEDLEKDVIHHHGH